MIIVHYQHRLPADYDLGAEIAEPRLWDGVQRCAAGWMGFRFLDLTVSDLRDAPAPPIKAPSDGTLMLKYIPRTGAWGEAELAAGHAHPGGRSGQDDRAAADGCEHRALSSRGLVRPPDDVPCRECPGGAACRRASWRVGDPFPWRQILPRSACADLSPQRSRSLSDHLFLEHIAHTARAHLCRKLSFALKLKNHSRGESQPTISMFGSFLPSLSVVWRSPKSTQTGQSSRQHTGTAHCPRRVTFLEPPL